MTISIFDPDEVRDVSRTILAGHGAAVEQVEPAARRGG